VLLECLTNHLEPGPALTKGLTGEKDEPDKGDIIVGVMLTLDIHTGGDAATTAQSEHVSLFPPVTL